MIAFHFFKLEVIILIVSVSSGDFAHLRIPGYFAHLLQHLKMKENDNSENSMIKNNPSLV